MAFSARLQFGVISEDNTTYYNVADCHLHFMRHYNHFRPDTDARCEKVELVVEAPGKTDLTFQSWYINNETQDGRIIFDIQSQTSENQNEKSIEFEGAYCYAFNEEYHINSQRCRYFRLSIVAEKITINSIAFKNLYASNS